MTADAPVVFDTRVVTGAGGGPEKTILNSPRFLEPLGYRMLKKLKCYAGAAHPHSAQQPKTLDI